MHQVIYSSRSTRSFSEAGMASLLAHARTKNGQRGITGVLLYGANLFLQVLEGERAVLEELCDALRHDPRHTGMVRLADKPIARRSFAEWAMAFQHVPPTEMTDLEGVLSEAQLTAQLNQMEAADALLMRSMRRLLGPAASA